MTSPTYRASPFRPQTLRAAPVLCDSLPGSRSSLPRPSIVPAVTPRTHASHITHSVSRHSRALPVAPSPSRRTSASRLAVSTATIPIISMHAVMTLGNSLRTLLQRSSLAPLSLPLPNPRSICSPTPAIFGDT